MQPTSPNIALATLAMIDAQASKGQTHLDNFVPFVVEVLRTDPQRDFSPYEVAGQIRESFGMKVPSHAIDSVLKRAARIGFAIKSNKQYKFNQANEGKVRNIQLEQSAFLRAQESLCTKFIEFVSSRYAITMERDEAELALFDQIEQDTVKLVSLDVDGSPYNATADSNTENSFLAAEFISHVTKSDQASYEWLISAAKGAMLAAFLHLPNAGEVDRKFEKTKLLIDTPILLQAAGLEGPESRDAIAEIMRLAKLYHAEICCFEHSVSEAEGVLHSAASTRRRGNTIPAMSQGVAAYAIKADISAAELEIRTAKFKDDITRLGIEIIDRPDPIEAIEIDEAALEEQLRSRVRYRYDAALFKDLNSLRAIHFMRRRYTSKYLESCKAVFITDNDQVANVGNKFFKTEGYDWPVATLISDLATILFLKAPQESPDLPRLRVVASAYAALEPSATIWSKWLDTLQHSAQASEITPQDIALLCHSRESRKVLMESTRGRIEQIGEDTVQEVLKKTRERLRAPAEREAQVMRESARKAKQSAQKFGEALVAERNSAEERNSEIKQLRDQLRNVEERSSMQLERIRESAVESARKTITYSLTILTALTVVPAVTFVVLSSLNVALPTGLKWVGYILGGIVAVLAGIRHIFGGSVVDWSKGLQAKLADRIERKRKGRLGLE